MLTIQDLEINNIFNKTAGNSFKSAQFLPVIQHLFFLTLYLLFLVIVTLLFLTLIRALLLLKKQLGEKPVLLELTPPAKTEQDSYTTEKLFSLVHALTNKRTFIDRLLGSKIRVSLEIVSTKNEGIRYLLRTTKSHSNTLQRSLLSYLPQLSVKKVEDYVPENIEALKNYKYEVVEFKLSHHFAFPLNKQVDLSLHDPIAYITGMMTN